MNENPGEHLQAEDTPMHEVWDCVICSQSFRTEAEAAACEAKCMQKKKLAANDHPAAAPVGADSLQPKQKPVLRQGGKTLSGLMGAFLQPANPRGGGKTLRMPAAQHQDERSAASSREDSDMSSSSSDSVPVFDVTGIPPLPTSVSLSNLPLTLRIDNLPAEEQPPSTATAAMRREPTDTAATPTKGPQQTAVPTSKKNLAAAADAAPGAGACTPGMAEPTTDAKNVEQVAALVVLDSGKSLEIPPNVAKPIAGTTQVTQIPPNVAKPVAGTTQVTQLAGAPGKSLATAAASKVAQRTGTSHHAGAGQGTTPAACEIAKAGAEHIGTPVIAAAASHASEPASTSNMAPPCPYRTASAPPSPKPDKRVSETNGTGESQTERAPTASPSTNTVRGLVVAQDVNTVAETDTTPGRAAKHAAHANGEAGSKDAKASITTVAHSPRLPHSSVVQATSAVEPIAPLAAVPRQSQPAPDLIIAGQEKTSAVHDSESDHDHTARTKESVGTAILPVVASRLTDEAGSCAKASSKATSAAPPSTQVRMTREVTVPGSNGTVQGDSATAPKSATAQVPSPAPPKTSQQANTQRRAQGVVVPDSVGQEKTFAAATGKQSARPSKRTHQSISGQEECDDSTWDTLSSWDERYAVLKRLYEEHGHTTFRQDKSKIVNWVNNTRFDLAKKRSAGKLTDRDAERVQKLDAINFSWPKSRPSTSQNPSRSSTRADSPDGGADAAAAAKQYGPERAPTGSLSGQPPMPAEPQREGEACTVDSMQTHANSAGNKEGAPPLRCTADEEDFETHNHKILGILDTMIEEAEAEDEAVREAEAHFWELNEASIAAAEESDRLILAAADKECSQADVDRALEMIDESIVGAEKDTKWLSDNPTAVLEGESWDCRDSRFTHSPEECGLLEYESVELFSMYIPRMWRRWTILGEDSICSLNDNLPPPSRAVLTPIDTVVGTCRLDVYAFTDNSMQAIRSIVAEWVKRLQLRLLKSILVQCGTDFHMQVDAVAPLKAKLVCCGSHLMLCPKQGEVCSVEKLRNGLEVGGIFVSRVDGELCNSRDEFVKRKTACAETRRMLSISGKMLCANDFPRLCGTEENDKLAFQCEGSQTDFSASDARIVDGENSALGQKRPTVESHTENQLRRRRRVEYDVFFQPHKEPMGFFFENREGTCQVTSLCGRLAKNRDSRIQEGTTVVAAVAENHRIDISGWQDLEQLFQRAKQAKSNLQVFFKNLEKQTPSSQTGLSPVWMKAIRAEKFNDEWSANGKWKGSRHGWAGGALVMRSPQSSVRTAQPLPHAEAGAVHRVNIPRPLVQTQQRPILRSADSRTGLRVAMASMYEERRFDSEDPASCHFTSVKLPILPSVQPSLSGSFPKLLEWFAANDALRTITVSDLHMMRKLIQHDEGKEKDFLVKILINCKDLADKEKLRKDWVRFGCGVKQIDSQFSDDCNKQQVDFQAVEVKLIHPDRVELLLPESRPGKDAKFNLVEKLFNEAVPRQDQVIWEKPEILVRSCNIQSALLDLSVRRMVNGEVKLLGSATVKLLSLCKDDSKRPQKQIQLMPLHEDLVESCMTIQVRVNPDIETQNKLRNVYRAKLKEVIGWIENFNKDRAKIGRELCCLSDNARFIGENLLETAVLLASDQLVERLIQSGAVPTAETLRLGESRRSIANLLKDRGEGDSLTSQDTKIAGVGRDWLYKHPASGGKYASVCVDFERTGFCLHQRVCAFAHCHHQSNSATALLMKFNDRNVHVLQQEDRKGKKWYTSGYVDGNDFFYAREENGVRVGHEKPHSLWWYETEHEARDAILAVVNSQL